MDIKCRPTVTVLLDLFSEKSEFERFHEGVVRVYICDLYIIYCHNACS